MNAIEFHDFSFTYKRGNRRALSHINLSVEPGEFTVIMGRNGAGKSTLCFSTNGIVPHFFPGEVEGHVRVFDRDTKNTKVSQLARRVGLVLQDFESQLFSSSVELEVAFGPENFGFPREVIRRNIKECLDVTGLSGYESRIPWSLSGGEKQRLAMASVLSWEPDIILLDEASTDLDPEGKEDLFEVVRRLANHEKTVMMATHSTLFALQAERLILLRHGEVAYDGPPLPALEDRDLLRKCGVRPLPFIQFLRRGELNGETLESLKHKLKGKPKPTSVTYHEGDVVIRGRDLCISFEESGFQLRVPEITIREGEFVAIIGRNGSGKTTLAKLLSGILKPERGKVTLSGMAERRELPQVVGYVFQNPDRQIFASTVEEEVAFGPRNIGMSRPETERKMREVLNSLGLREMRKDDPLSLPKGGRQKVALASILVMEPRVLVLDEPTSGLDFEETEAVMSLLLRLNQAGTAIVAITHSMELVTRYAGRVVVMDSGRIVADGRTRDIFADRKLLSESGIIPPIAVQIGHKLGLDVLTPDELTAYMEERP